MKFYTIFLKYLFFSDSAVPKTNSDTIHAILISGIPNPLLEAGSKLKAELSRNLQSEIQNIWVFFEQKLVVIKLDSSESVSRILQVHTYVLKLFLCCLSIDIL
jgi:hypothetical protein